MARKHKPSTALFKIVSPARREEKKNLSVVEHQSPNKGSGVPKTATHGLGCIYSRYGLTMAPGIPDDSRGDK